MERRFKAKLLRGSAVTAAGTVLMLVVHFVSLKVLAKWVPLEEFGIFSLLIVINQACQVVSGLGLHLTLVKNLSAAVDHQRKQQVVTIVFLARTVQLVLISLFVVALGQITLPRLFGQEIKEFILFLPVMFCLGSFRDLLFAFLEGRQRYQWHATLKVVSAVTRLAAILVLNHFRLLGVLELVWVEIITSSVIVTTLLLSSSVASFLNIGTIDRGAIRPVLGFSAPLYANDIFTFLYEGVSVLLLGALLTPNAVALYTIANKVPDALRRMLISMLVVYFPSMSELLGTGRREDGQRLMNLTLVLISAALTLVELATFFFRNEIILLLFSEQYLQAAPILALFMLSFVLSCIARLMDATAVAAGHASVPFRINFVTSVANALACLLMIPIWGVMGAVGARVVANGIAPFLYAYSLRQAKLSIHAREIATPLVMGLGLVAVYVWLANENLLTRGTLLIIYSGSCWLLIPAVRRCVEYGANFVAKFTHGLSKPV